MAVSATIHRFPQIEPKSFMKRNILSGMLALLAGSLLAAEANPKAEVQNAAAALGSQINYTWQATVEVPADSQFKPGPTDGKTEKGGYTTLSFNFGDNTTEAVTKGTNGAIKTDNGWQSLADAMKDNGDGGFNPTLFLARTAAKLQGSRGRSREPGRRSERIEKGHQFDFRRPDRGRRKRIAVIPAGPE